MLVKTFAAAVFGIEAVTVTIEVDVTRGVRYMLVGLPDAAVKESQQRIESAFRAAGLKWPGRQIVINMAPADIRKEGSSYDLPLAVGILAAAELADGRRMEGMMVTGELSLDGEIKPVRGVLPMALQARSAGFRAMMVPSENAAEAAVVEGLDVYGVSRLEEVLGFMRGEEKLVPVKVDIKALFSSDAASDNLDFADVKGQESVKRALEVAAAGSHNLIMIGPPGAGKTMLARRLPGIIPPLTLAEALETTKIHSVAGKTDERTSLMNRRPFRSPHHTISDIALVGGGNVPQPGEMSYGYI
jgi:magnesium chelatase family protein